MSALLEGFRTGWGAVNQHYQQEENKRRYDQGFERQQQQDVLLNQIRQNQIVQGQNINALGTNQVNRLEQTNAHEDTVRGQTVAGNALNLRQQGNNVELSNNAVNQIPENNAFVEQSREQQLAAGASQNAILDNTVNRLDKTNEMTDNMNAAQLTSTELQVAQQQKQVLNQDLQRSLATQDPEVIGEFMARNRSYLSGTNMVSFGTLEGINSAVSLGNALDTGDMATAAKAANTFFRPQLDKAVGQIGKNGQPITNIDISGVKNEGDGFKIPVMVTTQNGEKYPSFISQLRSADPNDPEKMFSPDELFGTIKATHSVAKLLEGSSYYGRLVQNAQNVRAAEKVPVKGKFKVESDAMGNPLYKVNEQTGAIIPFTDQEKAAMGQGIESTLTAEQLEERNNREFERAKVERESNISTRSKTIFNALLTEGTGLTEDDLQSIARKASIDYQDLIDAGKAANLNSIIEAATNGLMQSKKSNEENRAEINKQNKERPLTPGALY